MTPLCILIQKNLNNESELLLYFASYLLNNLLFPFSEKIPMKALPFPKSDTKKSFFFTFMFLINMFHIHIHILPTEQWCISYFYKNTKNFNRLISQTHSLKLILTANDFDGKILERSNGDFLCLWVHTRKRRKTEGFFM